MCSEKEQPRGARGEVLNDNSHLTKSPGACQGDSINFSEKGGVPAQLPETADTIDFLTAVTRKLIDSGELTRKGLLKQIIGLNEGLPSHKYPHPPLKEADIHVLVDGFYENTNKPQINANARNLAEQSRAAWAALQAYNSPPTIFKFNGQPCRLEKDGDGAVMAKPMKPAHMTYTLARSVRWYTKNDKGKIFDAYPPKEVVSDVLAEPDMELPALKRVVVAPIFAQDGTLVSTPGYHPEAEIFYRPDGLRVPEVSANPTEAEISEARSLIFDDLLVDFPFVGYADRANCLALFLLMFMRDMIGGPTPLHLIEKPTSRTGASLLADVLCIPPCVAPGATPEAENEAEWRKKIMAKLMENPQIFYVDNINRQLRSGALNAAITSYSNKYSDRILGKSEIGSAWVRCVFLATGNNPTVNAEVAGRTVSIRLDAQMERPGDRDPGAFKHPDLVGWVKENRGQLAWAALTLIQAWIARGKPINTTITMGGFEKWVHAMSGILEVAEVPGFMDNRLEFYERVDDETARLSVFVTAWLEEHKTGTVGTAELFEVANGLDVSPFYLKGNDPRAQKSSLGKQMKKLRDQVYVGHKITFAGEYKRAARWKLVPVNVGERSVNVLEQPSPTQNEMPF